MLRSRFLEKLESQDELHFSDFYFFKVVGRKLDCYFTLEQVDPNDGRYPPLLGRSVKGVLGSKSKQDVVKQLQQQLPAVQVYISPANPAVIHIVDGRLPRTGYGVNAHTNLNLTGTPTDLLLVLECQGLNVRCPLGVSIHGPPSFDFETRLRIHVSDRPVRRILTDHLPLSDYKRLLWVAETEVDARGVNTQVRFRGPIRRWATPDSREYPDLDDFAEGETVYMNNSGKPGAVEAALRFIDQCVNFGDTHQLRWALLFLGQEGSDRGIPTLLNNLEYCYTHCAVLEESYPAVKALRLIGEPAAHACLRELVSEQSPLRRKLLCEALTGIRGPRLARHALEDAVRTARDDTERVNLQAAHDLIPPPPEPDGADD
jgi:hypothetical protein